MAIFFIIGNAQDHEDCVQQIFVNGESGDGKDNIAYTECTTVGNLVNDLQSSENSQHNIRDGNTSGDDPCGDNPYVGDPCGGNPCGGDPYDEDPCGIDPCDDEIRPVEYEYPNDNNNAAAAGPPQNQDVASFNEEQTWVHFIQVFSS